MSALDVVLSALRSRRCEPKPNGSGYAARCPAHDDRNPSLSVSNGGGKVLLCCHAGCSVEAICDALGIGKRDLFDETTAEGLRNSQYLRTNPTDPPIKGQKDSFDRREVASYDYTDEDGRVLFQVVRFEPKDFRQRQPDGTWNVKGVRMVPYRLPAVLAAVEAGSTIFIAEGEKDCDALNAIEGQHVATCNPGGAGKWRDEYSAVLRGAHVVIVADRDKKGRDHAGAVAASLRGVAASCRIVEAKTGKDAADHLAAGHGLEDFIAADFPQNSAEGSGDDVEIPRPFEIPYLYAYVVQPIEDVAPGLPDRGKLLFVGQPGAAKSLLFMVTALQVASGRDVLGKYPTKRRRVSLFLEEDSADETIARFLMVTRALGITAEDLGDRFNLHPRGSLDLSNQVGWDTFRRILENEQPDLTMIDTFQQVSGVAKIADASEVRDWFKHIDPLLGAGLTRAVWIAHHPNKSVYAKKREVELNALTAGSIQFEGSVDAVAFLLRDPKDKDARVLIPSKYRQGRERGASRLRLWENTGVPPIAQAGNRQPLTLLWTKDLDPAEADKATRRPTVADKVLEILAADPTRAWSKDELAAAAKCSKRTAHDAVKDHDDVTITTQGKSNFYRYTGEGETE